MKKIMFNNKYGLTDAVLQGRKTMTRRVVQEKYLRIYEDMSRLGQPCYPLEEWLIRKSAAYKVGEVVAVAQSYKDIGYTKEWVEQHISPNPNANWNDLFEKKYPGWNNKMFTHSELEKVRKIEITNIKVELLQDISNEDCLKEGVLRREIMPFRTIEIKYQVPYTVIYKDNPREAFAALIDKVSGKGTWERNPWVFAYSFKLLK